jgi:sugar phosphate isomerase/epimerase
VAKAREIPRLSAEDSYAEAAAKILEVRVQELADHAAAVGVQLTLELYEDNFLGTADSSVRLVNDIGHHAQP